MKAPVFLLAIAFAVVARGASAQAPVTKGAETAVFAEIVFAQGDDIVILSSGKQRTIKDPIGERLSAGDQIQTGGKTSVELVLMPRKSRLRLSENTVATIREMAPDGTTGIDLLYGRIRSKVARITDREAQYNVRAPSVVAAVRGTDFGCDVILSPTGREEPTKVYCFEGSVDVRATRAPEDTASIAVDAGSMALVSVAPEGVPEIVKAAIDLDTVKFWQSNEFTEKLPAEEPASALAPIAPAPAARAAPLPAAPALDLGLIRKGIAAKNTAILGSGVLFIAGAALGGAGYYFKDSNQDLSDSLLLGGALTACLAIPSLVLAITIDPLAAPRVPGE